MEATESIVERLPMRLRAGPGPTVELSVECRYAAYEPYAVHMRFGRVPGTGDAVWVVSRELLLAGLRGPSGAGDVHVRPGAGEDTLIGLGGESGTAVLRVGTGALAAFLASTIALVPAGAESRHIDWDACISGLLSA
ncbi:SsgA family sporulation/cell division regulator [Streptomyces sp. NPDC058691]|uniref:SsgA family sporulation/cell division regulator n=1 Tax=Streptomyces sp. NPDC058691 TaxID=3346601 RepID=UPI0036606738